jgi:hypothetical protein
VHLVYTAFGALMSEMRAIETYRIILRLAKGKRNAPTFIVAADENVIHPRDGRTASQAVDQMKIRLARSAPPMVEGGGRLSRSRRAPAHAQAPTRALQRELSASSWDHPVMKAVTQ